MATTITHEKFIELYEEMLDEVYPIYKMGYVSFSPSAILRLCDPIAYRVGEADYADSLAEDGTLVEGYTD
jgi:hypothetical protein